MPIPIPAPNKARSELSQIVDISLIDKVIEYLLVVRYHKEGTSCGPFLIQQCQHFFDTVEVQSV